MHNYGNKVIYQIYPKSYKDSNGDGIGDFQGIIEKLDYLEQLGIDYIWLNACFVSPQNDNGYDVQDYYNIDPVYGSMEDFDALVKEAKAHHIEIMLDMVFNHTSTAHEWFQKALQGDKKYKDYYIWRKGKEDGTPPTNWVSKFGGNTWEYVERYDAYYLHLYDVSQADLNWDNPEVRDEMAKIVNFWMDKGVSGFRFDVVNLISKPEVLEDDYQGDGRRFYTDGPHVHEYLRQLNNASFGKIDALTVGEMSSTSLENCVKYAGENRQELSSVFNFHHLKVDYKNKNKWDIQEFDFQELKDLLVTWQVGMQEYDAWNALFWCNHDQPRVVSRFGNDRTYPKESAKMLATAIHMLRGIPYIYQGEEIGMTNAYFTDIKEYRDVESLNYYEILKQTGMSEAKIMKILQERSRDNARTPMQWDASIHAGFSDATPWIQEIKNYKEINVKHALADKDSVFYHYKKLIELRKTYPVIQQGSFEVIAKDHPELFVYKRILGDTEVLVINNFYGKQVDYKIEQAQKYELLLSNYGERPCTDNMQLQPYESLIYITKPQD
ncbi:MULTISPECIES: alpha,alpha-phosphotrehalase [unclassified Breznakia]|uniref:alpha,alpha-phosphotrehalase n=1 Tax=unclassified Breznakia TaxID=2623764 RepID=UPI002474D33D|nr:MULTISPECIES: alpha,alpha-phosphotrehalase [unclassified Breznakia]MDH6366816.1 trehalose-6-phosphate hydrolase [Breznakia sp. PH1-1]MDH6403994.1 trehalose-6-phosphate hydrolase [Breznakia sp. PF1-11]MDH6411784.1 trehalose-6-phosphate hydrolase [Breznakia sp. PFB1-11]MDH6413982.1 trehalose-6-phosphate hydrolase [Breznakia sp. PFB1-14]MDH6416412.1 trehalose-6-phosphate hydrolase [Breznakia sp. PFB1-4]